MTLKELNITLTLQLKNLVNETKATLNRTEILASRYCLVRFRQFPFSSLFCRNQQNRLTILLNRISIMKRFSLLFSIIRLIKRKPFHYANPIYSENESVMLISGKVVVNNGVQDRGQGGSYGGLSDGGSNEGRGILPIRCHKKSSCKLNEIEIFFFSLYHAINTI